MPPPIQFRIESQPSPDGWRLYTLPYAYPLEPEPRAALVSFVRALVGEARALLAGHHLTALLQYNQLNLGNSGHIFAAKAPEWGVDWGLGYWPERKPPTLWTVEDFTNLDIGEMPRPMMNQIFAVSKGDAAADAMLGEVLGLGPVIVALSDCPLDAVKARARQLFHPLIQDATLKLFPFYFPLLCTGTFAPENAAHLAEWTCGIQFYLREGPEEKGLFLASSRPLDDAFKRAGAQNEKGHWIWQPQPAKETR